MVSVFCLQLLGRSYENLACSAATSASTLKCALLKSLQCGCVLILLHLAALPPHLLVTLQRWLSSITGSLTIASQNLVCTH